jgi:hypothetical protein
MSIIRKHEKVSSSRKIDLDLINMRVLAPLIRIHFYITFIILHYYIILYCFSIGRYPLTQYFVQFRPVFSELAFK